MLNLNMYRKEGIKLYCFSPPVMLATFLIETILLVYTIWRYKLNAITRVIAALLLFLAIFQLAEYNVCGGYGVSAATWSRLGYVAITILPALGIHLLQLVSGRGWRSIKWMAYSTAAGWAFVFGLSKRAFSGYVCAGNYVIFQLNNHYGAWYFGYYYGWLIIGIALCLYFAAKAKHHIKEKLLLQVVGYLVFLLPTTIANTLKPATVEGIPSIMCGFAVIFAFILVFGILPLSSKSRVTFNQ